MFEDRIRALCNQLLRCKDDPESVEVIGSLLRTAIHEHLQTLLPELAEDHRPDQSLYVEKLLY